MNFKKVFMLGALAVGFSNTYAQSFTWISSTEGNVWKKRKQSYK